MQVVEHSFTAALPPPEGQASNQLGAFSLLRKVMRAQAVVKVGRDSMSHPMVVHKGLYKSYMISLGIEYSGPPFACAS